MKKKRHLLIALGVLAGLCVLYGALILAGKGDSVPEKPTEGVSVNERRDIVSVGLEPESGSPFVIQVDQNEAGERRLWIEGYENASLSFDFSALAAFVSGLERLKAYEEIEGEAAEYGISEASSKITIRFADKTMLTLRFGSNTPVEGRVYAAAEETGRVYVIRKAIAEACNQSVYDFRRPQLLADYLGGKEAPPFDRLELKQGDESRLTIRPQTAGEASAGASDAPSFYVIEEPVFRECSDGKIDSLILKPLLALEEKALVAEDFPRDLAAYGLTEKSASILLTFPHSACRIRLGGETEDGYVYGMREDLPSVVKIPKDALGVMNLKWFDVINTSLWMRSIDKLSSFRVSTPEKIYEMVLVRDQKGEISGGVLNGTAVEQAVVREIYGQVLNIHIEGQDLSAEKFDSPEYQITLRRLDGAEESMEFAPVDARTLAIAKNGEPLGFYTGVKGIQELCASLAALE